MEAGRSIPPRRMSVARGCYSQYGTKKSVELIVEPFVTVLGDGRGAGYVTPDRGEDFASRPTVKPCMWKLILKGAVLPGVKGQSDLKVPATSIIDIYNGENATLPPRRFPAPSPAKWLF